MSAAQLALALAVMSAVIFAPLCAWLAGRRDRSVGSWLVLGAVAGPLASVGLARAPPGRCPTCGTSVEGWPIDCPDCGSALDDGEAAPGEPTAPSASAAAGVTVAARSRRSGGIRRAAGTSVQDAGAETTMIATALFVSGSRDCEPGMHYLLTVRGSSLVVFGPLESSPHEIAVDRPLDSLMVTAFDQRLLISEASRTYGWSLGFQDLSGGTPDTVERTLLERGSQSGVG